MKKYILLLMAVMFISTSAFSQNKIRYQGEVEAGYTIGVGNLNTNRMNIHMINGIRFNQYASVGIGLGVDIYQKEDLMVEYAIPIFLNI